METERTPEDIVRAAAAAEPSDEDSNTLRIYRALDTTMMTAHRRGDVQSRLDAERTARILLAYADLPLVLRARACMVLGCGTEPDFLTWAREGVRTAQLIMDIVMVDNQGVPAGQVETQLLQHCQQVLAEALEAQAGLKQDDQNQDTIHIDVLSHDQVGEEAGTHSSAVEVSGATTTTLTTDATHGDNTSKSGGVTGAGGEENTLDTVFREPSSTMHVSNAPKLRTRRTHIDGSDNYQEFDLAVNRWVRLGTAVNPQYIPADDTMMLDTPPFTDPAEMDEGGAEGGGGDGGSGEGEGGNEGGRVSSQP